MIFPCNANLNFDPLTNEAPCKSCNKTIKDLSGLENNEFIKELEKLPPHFCAQMNTSQFTFPKPVLHLSFLKIIPISILGLLGSISNDVNAQTIMEADTVKMDTLIKNLQYPITIKGRVKNSETKEKKQSVNVNFYQKDTIIKSVVTDKNGNFKIVLNDGDISMDSSLLEICDTSGCMLLTEIKIYSNRNKIITYSGMTVTRGVSSNICRRSGYNNRTRFFDPLMYPGVYNVPPRPMAPFGYKHPELHGF